MKKSAFLVLVLSLFVLGNANILFGQVIPSKEICNGIDDNGDGQADEGIHCDHYLSYLVDKLINPITVSLHDQFIESTQFTLISIDRLLNPVRKIHHGMTFNPERPDLHYVAYRLETPSAFTPRQVLVENQFEKQIVSVVRPRYLLTPAGKTKIGIPTDILSHMPESIVNKFIGMIVPVIPQDANHYLCYEVEPYAVNAAVGTRDQFQEKAFEIIRARYLCNPAQKLHDGRVSEIIDENNHLMCYEVIPHNQVNRKVLTHDQFGIKSLNTVRTEELCVPSVKTHLTAACVLPDDNGTTVIFDNTTQYHNTDGLIVIEEPTALGTNGVTAEATLMSAPDTIIRRSGTPETGESYTFETEMLQLNLSGGRVLDIPVNGELRTGPRTPGDPVQTFDMDMKGMQGQLPPGDPDFDLLRITAGTDYGMPSPGHTTLTKLADGSWNIDSFFDITYRIDFVGTPGGPLSGRNGSTTATIRMATTCRAQR